MSTGSEGTSIASFVDNNAHPAAGGTACIAGYELQERIGVGGFGEVWRAIGPGGLPKAVKILHGHLDDRQAHIELKALERMRELRHPFLLNLERIEVCNERLIVVTELADRCLEDRFEEARREGHRGIPRDELMGYLRDAADALDFMFEQHGLQHLDIKPENLLLQGNHVKIGDFGLARDVRHTAVSMVGGFTPLYAPPELFEGEPQRTSDQYSLAIVYQVMLTGCPPFAGRTAAQLTAQHLRHRPDLSALQPVDRPVIARALSKNPRARFQNCRQFVDELFRRRTSRARSTRSVSTGERPGTRTEVLDPARMATRRDHPVRETVPLAPLPHDPNDTTFRPAIFIAAGGLGGRALAALRQLSRERFGNSPLPAFPLLYIDTDSRAIDAFRLQGDQPGHASNDAVCIPLRSPQEFCRDSETHLGWISRRWLYNIPRSRQVEGLRPLGRLALVDHSQTVQQRLREVLAAAVTEQAVRETAQHSGLSVTAGPPDIFIVAATCGGTGSGTVMDLGWLTREICNELHIQPGQISAVLLHGTGTGRQTSDLQRANTISFLTELQHFSTPGVEGPRGLNPDSTRSEAPPFDHACFIHLGDGLTDHNYAEQIACVGDYLCENAVSTNRMLFRRWRETSLTDAVPGTMAFRAVGIASLDELAQQDLDARARELSRCLLAEWFSAPDDTSSRTFAPSDSHGPDLRPDTSSLIAELGLNADNISTSVVAFCSAETGRQLEVLSRSCREALIRQTSGTDPAPAMLFTHIDDVLADVFAGKAPSNVAATSPAAFIRNQLNQLSAMCQQARTRIRRHLIACLARPGGARAASQAVRDLCDHIDAAVGICSRLRHELERSATEVHRTWSDYPDPQPLSPKQAEDLKIQARQYCVLLCSLEASRRMLADLGDLRGWLTGVGADLVTLKQQLQQSSTRTTSSETGFPEVPPDVVEAFNDVLTEHGASRLESLWDRSDANSQLAAVLQRHAVEFLAAGALTMHAPRTGGGRPFPESAHPPFTDVGGGRRVLAVLPEVAPQELWQNRLVAEFGNCVSLATAHRCRLSVYCEVERIAIADVLTYFTRYNPRLQEIAARVHSRNDIDW